MSSVYLAGPITGCTYDGCTDWREQVRLWLEVETMGKIKGISPMRNKQYLFGEEQIDKDYEDYPLSCQKGIMTRDHYDCFRADLVLVNLLGTGKVSIGTVMEIAWAHTHQIPIILVMEEEGNVHDHPMIREAAGFRAPNLRGATDIAKHILEDYG